MLDISSLSPEQQAEMRRVFPEEFAENATPSVTSYSVEEPIINADIIRETPDIEDADFEEVENILEEVITVEELIETTPTPSLDVAALIEEADLVIANAVIPEERLDIPVIIPEVKAEPVKVQYSRFKGAFWFEIVQQQEIILAGLGGIGSYVNFALSRLGPRALYLFDDDKFESHNMSGQFVSKNDINKFKVEVAKKYSQNFSNYNPYIYPQKYIKDACMRTKVMICGFDNMKARKDFYESWKSNIIPENAHEYLFIDGRLLAEEYQIICLTGDDTFYQSEYERNFLFSDEEVIEVDCTMKQTSHMAMMIGAEMTKYFINFCNNLSVSNFPRRLPFYVHHNALMNTYEFKY